MGLFDNLTKAVTAQETGNNYAAILQANDISINGMQAKNEDGILTIWGTVPDMETAEKAATVLKGQAGISQVVNLLETEDLTSQNLHMLVATEESNLNIRSGPGTEYDIIGKAAHNSKVQLIKRMYNDWYYIKTDTGAEGFCAKTYLKEA